MSSTASTDDVTVAFAKASRRLKSLPNPPFDVKDLTTALSQLEGHAEDALKFEYRVPADTRLATLNRDELGDDAGSLDALNRATTQLLEWQWPEAIETAKTVLLQTDREDLRDEALNVIAAASALSGDNSAAIAALTQAVQGDWNFSLQQNLGIVALNEDPELAANQSTYWLDAAENREDREKALFFVMNMWASLETEEQVALPERIRDSFRKALSDDMSLETFALLGMFLARNDSEWTALPDHWIRSPHATTDVAAMFMARAEGFDTFIDFLIDNASNSDAEISRAREGFISELIDAMWDEEPAMWAAWIASSLVDKGLPCESTNHALLRMLGIREIVIYFREHDGEPKDDYVQWLLDVDSYLRAQPDGELKETLQEMLSEFSSLFVLGYLAAREREMNQMADTLNMVHSMATNWMSRRRLNKPQARMLASNMLNWSKATGAMVTKFRKLPIKDEEIRELIDDLARRQVIVQQMSQEIMRSI
jgi:hypothetical protein